MSVVEAVETAGTEATVDSCSADVGTGGGGGTAVAEATGVDAGTEVRQPKCETPGGQ